MVKDKRSIGFGFKDEGGEGDRAEMPIDDCAMGDPLTHLVVVGGFGAGEEPLHESVFVGFGGFDRTDGFALTEVEIDGEFVEVGECAVESIALGLAFGFGEDAIAEFGSLADEGGEGFGGSVEGEVDANEALEGLEAFFGVVGDREDFFRGFVVGEGFAPFGLWGCAIGIFPMGITEFSLKVAVTKGVSFRRAIG